MRAAVFFDMQQQISTQIRCLTYTEVEVNRAHMYDFLFVPENMFRI